MFESQDTIIWGRKGNEPLLAEKCPHCEGMARIIFASGEADECENCQGQGWFGIDPRKPVKAGPGSVEKIAMLSVRYASGVPLWNGDDGPEPEVPEHLRSPEEGEAARKGGPGPCPLTSSDGSAKKREGDSLDGESTLSRLAM